MGRGGGGGRLRPEKSDTCAKSKPGMSHRWRKHPATCGGCLAAAENEPQEKSSKETVKSEEDGGEVTFSQEMSHLCRVLQGSTIKGKRSR